jgi:hypothetical protein
MVALAVALAALQGCASAIGDECDYDTDCPAGAYCDSSMPGGMCTDSPCRAGDCPDDSVCVEFSNGQSYCMASCGSDGDCRDGYSCITDIGPYPFCSVKK